jgi:hypothetical protein
MIIDIAETCRLGSDDGRVVRRTEIVSRVLAAGMFHVTIFPSPAEAKTTPTVRTKLCSICFKYVKKLARPIKPEKKVAHLLLLFSTTVVSRVVSVRKCKVLKRTPDRC